MRIGRVIMDIGVSKNDLEKYSDKWTGLKTIILTNYQKNYSRYLSRIKKIIATAIENKADIILLPAYSIINTENTPLNIYQEILNDNVVIISGSLDSIKKQCDELPVTLLANNKFIRFFEIKFKYGFMQKAYGFIATPKYSEIRYEDKFNRELLIFDEAGDIQGTEKEKASKSQVASLILKNYARYFDYTKNLLSIEQTITKIQKINLISKQSSKALRKLAQVAEEKDSLLNLEKIVDNYWERFIIFNRKNIIHNIEDNKVIWMKLKNVNTFSAISSSITNIYKEFDNIEVSEKFPPDSNSKQIAFDAGHHQYSGRYKNSLKRVVKFFNTEYKKDGAIFLAYWKYLNSKTNYVWAESSENNLKLKRIIVNSNEREDFIDIFDI